MLLKNYFLAENIVFITIAPRNKFYLHLYGRIIALYVKISLVMYTTLSQGVLQFWGSRLLTWESRLFLFLGNPCSSIIIPSCSYGAELGNLLHWLTSLLELPLEMNTINKILTATRTLIIAKFYLSVIQNSRCYYLFCFVLERGL